MAGRVDIYQKDVFIRIYTDGSGPDNFKKQRPFAYIEFNHQAYAIAGSADELRRKLLALDADPTRAVATWELAAKNI
ncbi:MAG: hypothetical protein AABX60_02545 [Nanoarchaeota archaeon]